MITGTYHDLDPRALVSLVPTGTPEEWLTSGAFCDHVLSSVAEHPSELSIRVPSIALFHPDR